MTVILNFLREWCNHHWVFFIGISTRKVKWCAEDSLPSFVAFLSTRNQSVSRIDWMLKENPPWDFECTPSTQGQLVLHQSGLELLESEQRNFWNPRSSQSLESCLAASFMNKSKPLFIREISCSMFCERFQQYWPCGVPMSDASDWRSS